MTVANNNLLVPSPFRVCRFFGFSVEPASFKFFACLSCLPKEG